MAAPQRGQAETGPAAKRQAAPQANALPAAHRQSACRRIIAAMYAEKPPLNRLWPDAEVAGNAGHGDATAT